METTEAMTRRGFLERCGLVSLGATGLVALGCSRRAPRVGLNDSASLAQEALLDVLIGPPVERTGSQMAPPDAPLMKKGVYENVLIATDIEGFVKASRGALRTSDMELLQSRVVEGVDRVLKRREFGAGSLAFPPQVPPGTEKTLLATITPETEQGGSPAERARGNAAVLVLIRMTISDPVSGKVLRVRDFYSGRDVEGTGDDRNRRPNY